VILVDTLIWQKSISLGLWYETFIDDSVVAYFLAAMYCLHLLLGVKRIATTLATMQEHEYDLRRPWPICRRQQWWRQRDNTSCDMRNGRLPSSASVSGGAVDDDDEGARRSNCWRRRGGCIWQSRAAITVVGHSPGRCVERSTGALACLLSVGASKLQFTVVPVHRWLLVCKHTLKNCCRWTGTARLIGGVAICRAADTVCVIHMQWQIEQ